ncbi:MAG: hypothetical protein WD969_03470 [Paracoccaceae bacterium]
MGVEKGFDVAVSMAGSIPHSMATTYSLPLIPTFILIGYLACYAGLTRYLLVAAKRWAGWLPGGHGALERHEMAATEIRIDGEREADGDDLHHHPGRVGPCALARLRRSLSRTPSPSPGPSPFRASCTICRGWRWDKRHQGS